MIHSGMIEPNRLLLIHRADLAEDERRDPDDQMQPLAEAALCEPLHVAPQDCGVHAELGLSELRARDSTFLARPDGSHPGGRIDGRVRDAHEEGGRPADLAAVRQLPAIPDRDRGRGEPRRIEIEHRLGFRLITSARIVASQAPTDW